MTKIAFDKIDEFARSKLSGHKAAGFIMSMKGPGDERHQMSYGFSDVENRKTVSENTCFGIASLSKIFTALATLNLFEDGKLDLLDTASEHFNELENTVFDRITIHHLLSNSTGISTLGYAERSLMNQISNEAGPRAAPTEREESLVETLKHADKWILSEPGTKFTYLNEGYGLLHLLIERLTGSSYAKYIEDNIFNPLNLENTFFIGRADLNKHHIATGYSSIEGNDLHPVPPRVPDKGNGSIFSSVKDMGILLCVLINKGEYKGRKIFASSVIERLETENVKLESIQIGENGPFTKENQYYGYGINIDSDFHGQRMFSHAGSVFYYTSYMSYIPESRSYFVAFSNSTNYPPGNIAKYALTAMEGKDPEKLDFIKNELVIGELSGTYSSHGNSISIEVQRLGSYLEAKPNYSKERNFLIPEQISERLSTFYMLQGYTKIFAIFTKDAEGKLELNYAGQRLKKVK